MIEDERLRGVVCQIENCMMQYIEEYSYRFRKIIKACKNILKIFYSMRINNII